MAKTDWTALQGQFLAAHAESKISPKDWCEAQGLNYGTAKRHIKIANYDSHMPKIEKSNKSANSQKKTANPLKKKDLTQKSENSKAEKVTPPPKAKRQYNHSPKSIGRPFTTGNTAAVTHGGYLKRMLIPDDVAKDAASMTLRDELILMRSRNLIASSYVGSLMAKIEQTEDLEEISAYTDLIDAAEKSMTRNIARIESIERTLSALNYERLIPEKMETEMEHKRKSIEKMQAETEILKNGDGGQDHLTVYNILPMAGSSE